jgi:hypothetical protein
MMMTAAARSLHLLLMSGCMLAAHAWGRDSEPGALFPHDLGCSGLAVVWCKPMDILHSPLRRTLVTGNRSDAM